MWDPGDKPRGRGHLLANFEREGEARVRGEHKKRVHVCGGRV